MNQAGSSRRPRDEYCPADAVIGREVESAALQALLDDPAVRLVTITGVSGIGKSVLAKAVAADIGRQRGRASVAVALSAIRDPALIPGAVAAGLRDVDGPGPVVLDGAECVAQRGDYLRMLLDSRASTQFLVTSTVPLRVAGEHLLRLGPLDAPDPDHTAPADLIDAPAVQLFLARAVAADAHRSVGSSDVATIAALCHRLGGLPLAIELAAARTPTLTPAAILAQLGQRQGLDVLSGRSRERPKRHRSVRDALAWTCGLLDEAEAGFLGALGVFEGRFGTAAAGQISGITDLGALLDLLSILVDMRLVDPVAEPGMPPRFGLPPLVRDFVRAAWSERVSAVLDEHTEFVVALCREAAERFETGDQPVAFALLEPEWAEISAVLDRLVSAGRHGDALRTAVDCAPFLLAVGYDSWSWQRLERLIIAARESDADPAALARALIWSAKLVQMRPDAPNWAEHMEARLAEGIELARRHDDQRTVLMGLEFRALGVPATGDLEAAERAAEAGLELAVSLGDERWRARFEARLSMLACRTGEYVTARDLGVAALARARRIGDLHGSVMAARQLLSLPPEVEPAVLPDVDDLLAVARASRDNQDQILLLSLDGFRAIMAGDVALGVDRTLGCLALLRDLGALDQTTPLLPLVNVVLIATRCGDEEIAVRLAATIAPREAVLAVVLTPWKFEAYLAAVADHRSEIAGFGEPPGIPNAAWSAMEYLGAVVSRRTESGDGVGGDDATPRSLPAVAPLTPRELEVLAELASGRTNKEIARALGLTAKTVMHHTVSVYQKLSVRGRAEATAWAYRHGVVGSETGR